MTTNVSNFDSQFEERKLRKIFEGLGMCLSNYQQIERCLKFVVPHMVAPSEVKDAIPYEDWPSLFQSKKTLGQLVIALSSCSNEPDGETLFGQLHNLVEERNELVHHFYDQPFGKFENKEDFESAISYIRRRLLKSNEFLKVIRHMVTVFMLAVEESFKMQDLVQFESGVERK
jgi:hypothetical protein